MMTREEFDKLPERTSETVYEDGKYYRTMHVRLHEQGYAFRAEFKEPSKGYSFHYLLHLERVTPSLEKIKRKKKQ